MMRADVPIPHSAPRKPAGRASAGRASAGRASAGRADPLLTQIDLNLLRVLAAVDASRHVTLAAERLGITQSAVSNALSRLRRHCGDDLFVRTPQGMAPTPFGESLAAAARQALSNLSSTLTAGLPFEPARSTRQFTIRMTDIGEIVFLPALLDAFAARAPNANLRTVSLSSGDTTAALADGAVERRGVQSVEQRAAGEPQARLAGREEGDAVFLEEGEGTGQQRVGFGGGDAQACGVAQHHLAHADLPVA